MNRILLTGATGFIGSHILEALTAAGLPVIALVRPHADRSRLTALKTEVRYGDVRDLPGMRAAVRGCDEVIHTAALAKDWGRREEFYETNVTGTLQVLEACRLERIPHVILTGSISSYGEEDSARTKDEMFPFHSHYPYFLDGIFPSGLNGYRDSKALATEKALAFAQSHNLNVTLLEPVWVFGEREFGTGFYAYVKAVQQGARFMPGSTRNCFHVIYARDLAKAYLLACQRKLPGVERFIIGNRAAEPMHRIFGLFCREAGLTPPRLIPKWGAYPIGFFLELLYTIAQSTRPPLLSRGRVNMFYDSIQFSTEKAKQKLGFQCDYTLEQGIRQTVAWYKNKHYL
jgi:nucleoside-diphosphate-sugar epimerase